MPRSKTVKYSSEDAEMSAAIRKAKETIEQFFEAFVEQTEGQKSFLLKVVFDKGDQREHIWLADLDFRGSKPSGVIANEPKLPNLKFMQRVKFNPSHISDWMYVEDDYLIGGYTTRLIRHRMTPKVRREFDARSPYKFK